MHVEDSVARKLVTEQRDVVLGVVRREGGLTDVSIVLDVCAVSVPDFPGLSRDFDCFDFILEWDGISGMEVVFDSLIFLAVLIV